MTSPVVTRMVNRARARALTLLLIVAALIVAALISQGVMTGAEVADKGIDAVIGFALVLKAVRL